MITLHPQYITDSAGKKMVILPITEFDQLIEELDELEDIRLYDESKSDNEQAIPIDEAFQSVELKRKSSE